MKKTDIAMIVFIATISMLIAFFVTRAIFGGAANEPVTVKTVEAINAEVVEPSSLIFNDQAINPSVEVQVGSEGQ